MTKPSASSTADWSSVQEFNKWRQIFLTQPVEVRLPRTVDDVEESVVVLWYKAEGEQVKEHDVLLEVQSEKATFEIEAPTSGTLREIRVGRAEVAAVGDILGIIETTTDQEIAVGLHENVMTQDRPSPPQDTVGSPQQDTTDSAPQGGISDGFVSAPPRIRRLASQLDVDLAGIQGTGPNGRITEEDLQNAVQMRTSTRHHVEPMSAVRRAIAKRMVQSLQHSAQLTLTSWADVSKLSAQRQHLSPGVSWNTWVLAAVVRALKKHPYLNATTVEDAIHFSDAVHLGVAVDTDTGLMVAVIRDADKKGFGEIQAEAVQLADKVRSGTASSAELSGSTFTVTNLGSYGVEFFTPILNPPEVAILGVGKIDEKVVFQENSLSVIHRIPLSLTFDHQVTDGGPAARFLESVANYLDKPEQLL